MESLHKCIYFNPLCDTNAQVPEVMEYVTEKADLYELNKKVKSWERKVDIAEVQHALCVSALHLAC